MAAKERSRFGTKARDITEQERVREQLARAKRQWERTFDAVPDLIAVIDPQHRIVQANRAMAQCLGVTPSQCVGLVCYEHVHGTDRPPEHCPHAKLMCDGRQHAAEVSEERLGGDFLVTCSPMVDHDGTLLGSVHVARDITSRKRREAELFKLNRTLRAICDSHRALAGAAEGPAYLQEICRIIAEDCGHTMAWIGLAEHDEAQSVRVVASAGFEDGYLDTLRLTWADRERGRGPTGTAIRTARVCICRAMENDPALAPWREEALRRGFASSISLPLVGDGRAFGAITIYSRETDPFTEDEVGLLTELAGDVARGITMLRLRAAGARAEEAVRRLAQFPEQHPNPVLRAAEDGTVIYANPPGQTWLAALGSAVGRTLPAAARELAAEAFHAAHVVEAELEDGTGHTHWFAAVRPAGEPYTNLYGRDVTVRVRQERRLGLLSEVAARLLSADHPQQIVESLCRKLMEHLDCQVFFNFLMDHPSGRLHLNACAGVPDDLARQIEWLELGMAVCGCVAREGAAIAVDHIQTTTDSRADLVRSMGIEAYACHPLMIEGQVIGTLSFGSRTKRAFAADDLALMWDVTNYVAIAIQRVRLMDSLERHAEAADAANQAKSRFLATMSHEIRTPLTAILGISELSLGQPLAPGVRDDLQTIGESASSLMLLLDEILDSARIDAGMVALESIPFDVRSTVAQAVKVVAARAGEKGLELVCDLSDELPHVVIGDPLRLRQVLLNLVANAVKFTASGRVAVRVAAERRDCSDFRASENGTVPLVLGSPSSADLHFSVSDTGIGIAPEEQKRIFSPFAQAGASTARRYGGSGLGLSICQRLLDLMGGRIWVESELGAGSTFHFAVTLPIAESSPAGQPTGEDSGVAQPPPAVPQRTTQPRAAVPQMALGPAGIRTLAILLADDGAVGQRLVSQILDKRGHRALVARSGQEALDLLRRRHFDAVLMDVEMPGMDGFQATAAIRRLDDPHKARVPIIAMTAHGLAGDRQRCLSAGMDAYLSKPVDGDELIAVVERLAGRDGGRQECLPHRDDRRERLPQPDREHGGGRDDRPSGPRPGYAVFELDTAVKQCLGKYEVLQEVIECLFDDADPQLHRMRTAVDQNDPQGLFDAAHRLKNTLAYLGAAPAVEAAHHLELAGRGEVLALAPEAVERLAAEVEALKNALARHRRRPPAVAPEDR